MPSVTFALFLQGLGTDEGVLIEILCTRSNAEINAIKQSYQRRELGLIQHRHFTRLCNCNRNEPEAYHLGDLLLMELTCPGYAGGICFIFPVRLSVRTNPCGYDISLPQFFSNRANPKWPE